MKEKQTLPLRKRRAIFERDNYTCFYCGKAMAQDAPSVLERATVDHMMPCILGGSDEPDNLVTACWACNASKGNKHLEEYRLYMQTKACPSLRVQKYLMEALTELRAAYKSKTPIDLLILKAIEWCDKQATPYVFWGEKDKA